MGNSDEPLKEEEAEVENRNEWRCFALPRSGAWVVMPPDDERGWGILNDAINVSNEASARTAVRVLNTLEAEVKALKPLAELAGEVAKRRAELHAIEEGGRTGTAHWTEDDVNRWMAAQKAWVAALDALTARYDSALKAQGEQANPSEEER